MTKRLSLSFLWIVVLMLLMGIIGNATANELSCQITAKDSVPLGNAQNIDVVISAEKPKSARIIVEILDLDRDATIKIVDEQLKLMKGKNYLSSLLNKDIVWIPKSVGNYTIRITLQSDEQNLVTEKTFKVTLKESWNNVCTLCTLRKQNVTTVKINSVKVFRESSTKTITIKAIGVKLSFSINWSIPECPIGYPCSSGKAIVLPTQSMVIAGSIKNVGDQPANNVRVIVSLYNSSGKVQDILDKTISSLNALETKTLADLNGGSDLVWSPKGMKPDSYYFKMTVKYEIPSGIPFLPPTTVERSADTPRFEVGKVQMVEFRNVKAEKMSYYNNETLFIDSNASVVNIGNVDIKDARIIIEIWKWNNSSQSWNVESGWPMKIAETQFELKAGEEYNLSQLWPANGINLSTFENGTYKINVKIVDSRGKVLDQMIGANPVGKMELGLPEVKVEKFLDKTRVSTGSDSVNVTLKVTSSVNSILDCGIFTVAEKAKVQELDVLFLLDTSGSMYNEWHDLCNIIGNITEILKQYANVTYKIYGLGNYTWDVNPSDTWCADGYWERGYFNGSDVNLTGRYDFALESYGVAVAGAARYYNWREGAVRVIFVVADEGPYAGVPNDEYDEIAIDTAINECKANNVIVYALWGDLGNYNEMQKNIQHMKRLANETGGYADYWKNESVAYKLITTGLIRLAKIAGSDVTIKERVVNDPSIEIDTNSFRANGVSFTPSITTKDGIKEIKIDKMVVPELSSISTDPREEIVITYRLNLKNLTAGEMRKLTDNTTVEYKDVMGVKKSYNITSAYVYTKATCNVLIVFDELRMRQVYGDQAVDELKNALEQYAQRVDGCIFNVSKWRLKWEESHGDAFASENNKREWARDLDEIIASVVLDRGAKHVVIVGGDSVIPFYSFDLDDDPVRGPERTYLEGLSLRRSHGWEDKRIYDAISGKLVGWDSYEPLGNYDISSNSDNHLWTDEPYSDLNDDYYPDVSIARLPGTPQHIITALKNSRNQYQSNQVLMAGMGSTVDRRDDQVAQMFRNEWGFSNVYTYFEKECATRLPVLGWCIWWKGVDDVADITIGGKHFRDRVLDDPNTIIYMNGHGNDYREWGERTHTISDESDRNGGIDGPKEYLRATDINRLDNAHPFVISEACHGGIVFPEDDSTPNNNFPLAFLTHGAVAYLGSTGYAPFGGSDDLGYYFFKNAKDKIPIGEALLKAKRDTIFSNSASEYWIALLEFTLYGDPTYMIYVPNDPPSSIGYNITEFINDTDVIVWVNVTNYILSNVTVSNQTLDLITIPGSVLHKSNYEPVVPVITHIVTLPKNIDIENLTYTLLNQTFIENVTLPHFLLGPKSVGGGYILPTANVSEPYPQKPVEIIKINETSGNKTVAIRVYPLQYYPSQKKAVLYRNITISTKKIELPPQPLARLDVKGELKEVTSLSKVKNKLYLTLKNVGELDLKNIRINIDAPPELNLSTTTTVDELKTMVMENFKILEFTFKPPIVNNTTTYDVNVTVNYLSESGVTGEPIHQSVKVVVKKPDANDVVGLINDYKLGVHDVWDVFGGIQAYRW